MINSPWNEIYGPRAAWVTLYPVPLDSQCVGSVTKLEKPRASDNIFHGNITDRK